MIVNIDCFEYMKKMKDSSVDLILTDPPYGIGYKLNISKNKSRHFDHIKNDQPDDVDWCEFLNEAYRLLKPKKTLYLFGRLDFFMRIASEIEQSEFRFNHDILWIKGDMASGNINIFGQTHESIIGLSKGSPDKSRQILIEGNIKKRSAAAYYGKLSKKEYYGHPTQKPVGLLSYLIQNRTDAGDTVFDPFMGSASTGVAAEILDRKFVGCELDEKYYDIAKKRLNDKEHIGMYEDNIKEFIFKNGAVSNEKLN